MTTPHIPIEFSGAVPEGFTLPHNTTVTMADVWAAEEAPKAVTGRELELRAASAKYKLRAKNKALNAGLRAQAADIAETERQQRFLADCERHSNLPKITPAGKFSYAGYEGE